ncbi:hypothetical protein ACFP51_19030 [Streptomyces pratens]|uniref:Uncharacterized protein n=1 Tax=Streptomyces pratens TaxID=887456 RepID=A0ABW1LX97_9ACTN
MPPPPGATAEGNPRHLAHDETPPQCGEAFARRAAPPADPLLAPPTFLLAPPERPGPPDFPDPSALLDEVRADFERLEAHLPGADLPDAAAGRLGEPAGLLWAPLDPDWTPEILAQAPEAAHSLPRAVRQDTPEAVDSVPTDPLVGAAYTGPGTSGVTSRAPARAAPRGGTATGRERGQGGGTAEADALAVPGGPVEAAEDRPEAAEDR